MPGPGGGSRGGGGFRGGGGSFGGGGFRGPRPGGFGGPRPRPFRPMGGMHMGGWPVRRRYNVGGGCLGALFAPFVILLMIVFSFIWMIGDSEGSLQNYDEEVFQDYANNQYQSEFGTSSAYEDNLLIVFLTDEEHYEYAYIAWVGDHIVMDINHMLGAEGTELGYAMDNCINASNYKYSLDTDLSFVMGKLTHAVQKMELESSFLCDEEHAQVRSHLTNYTDLEMNTQVVEDALAEFTQVTGIPAVIVVEDMDDVFGGKEGTSQEESFPLGAVLLVAAVIVIVVVILTKKKKKDQDDFGTPNKDSRYHEFDDQY